MKTSPYTFLPLIFAKLPHLQRTRKRATKCVNCICPTNKYMTNFSCKQTHTHKRTNFLVKVSTKPTKGMLIN